MKKDKKKKVVSDEPTLEETEILEIEDTDSDEEELEKMKEVITKEAAVDSDTVKENKDDSK